MHIENAQITYTQILFGRGSLTIFVHLQFAEFEQNFGGIKLDSPGGNYCAQFMSRVMRVVGVDDWSKLIGKSVRAEVDGDVISGIGHVLHENWFRCHKDIK